MVGHTDKPVYTFHTDLLSNWYISLVPGGMPWYDELWLEED